MGDQGWWVIIFIVSMLDPVVVGAGVFVGLGSRVWAHVALSVLLVPACYWLVDRLEAQHFAALLPVLALAGLPWSVATFGFKRCWQAQPSQSDGL